MAGFETETAKKRKQDQHSILSGEMMVVDLMLRLSNGNRVIKSLKHSFVISLFSFNLLALTAQTNDLRVQYFSREDGILSSFISNVTQDSSGFIWVASRDGLFKYDGYGFKGYYTMQHDSTSLPSNTINYIYTDTKGRLWIATDRGICWYRADQDKFERITDSNIRAGLDGMSVSYISQDLKGNVLVIHGSAIIRYLEKEKTFAPVFSIKTGEINHFAADSLNRLWIACNNDQGLIRYDQNTGMSNKITVSGGAEKDALNYITISRLAFQKHHLWIATMGQGIQRLDISTGILTRYPFRDADDAICIHVSIDNQGNVWTTDYVALNLVNQQSGTLKGYFPLNSDPHSVRSDAKGIFQDKQGNYWVYHQPGGIGISMQLKGFQHYDNDPNERWYTSGDNVDAIHEDSEGNLWMGYHEGGLDVFNRQKGKILRYHHDEHDKYSLGRGSVLCIFRDSHGTMWVSSYFGGLQYYSKSSGKFISYVHDPDNPGSIAGHDIRSIAEDTDGNLWMAIQGKGVDKFDMKKKTFTHYNNAQNKLSSDWPFQLLFNQSGDLWVATSNGLNVLKKGAVTFDSYLSNIKDAKSLSGNYINALHVDSNQVLWVGTSAGLNRYNTAENNFTRFIGAFESDFITAIEHDSNNKLWISTLSGIARFDPETGEIQNFSSIDGLRSDEFNLLAIYKDSHNTLYFGGTHGVDFFNPERLVYNTTPPPVIIDRIKILNKELITSITGKLKKHISYTDTIMLSYRDKMITLNFKALNFINPQNNQYAYMLEGFEKKWNYVGTINEATYTNLDPGKYIFRVKAANNDGVWNITGDELVIVISPPWYMTLASKIAMVLIIVAIIAGYVTIRTAKLNKLRLLLEETVEEKTSELSEKNGLLHTKTENLNAANKLLIDRQHQLQKQSDELKQQSASLADANHELKKLNATKDKLFSIIAHDLTNPFNTIIGFSEILSTRYDTLSDEEKLSYVTIINNSSEKVYALLQSLLMWSRSQTDRISYNPEKIHLKVILREALDLSSENLNAKKIRVSVDCPDSIEAWADRQMLQTIVRNMLNNAIKFTPRMGSICMAVGSDDSQAMVSITDTGIGIRQDKINELLSSETIIPQQGTEGETGSGLGLMLCKDFIQRNGGNLQISSETGKGSTFTFSLPINKAY